MIHYPGAARTPWTRPRGAWRHLSQPQRCRTAMRQGTGTAAPGRSLAPARAAATATAGAARALRAASLRVLTEPDAGIGPIYRLIAGARSSVDLTMYELADPRAEADLAADAARGVDVRVILDQHLEKSRNRGRVVHVYPGSPGKF